MNNYRFRLVLASVSLTAALTVLALKLAGFISPSTVPGDLLLHATDRGASSEASPYQVLCRNQVAVIIGSGQNPRPLRLLDSMGRTLSCRNTP